MADEPIDGTLADGLLATNANVLYTVPDGRKARISWVSAFNDSGGNVVCTFYIRRNGNSRRFARVTLAAGGGQAQLVDADEGLRLSAGDALQGMAGTVDVIEYVVCGVEEAV